MSDEKQIDWMPEARHQAAQCWCDPETEDRTMDPVLAEAVAKRICSWMETAAQNQRNADYYRGLVEQCGEAIGEAAYIQDDGGKSEDVLCAKVPELVQAAARDNKRLLKALEKIRRIMGDTIGTLAEYEDPQFNEESSDPDTPPCVAAWWKVRKASILAREAINNVESVCSYPQTIVGPPPACKWQIQSGEARKALRTKLRRRADNHDMEKLVEILEEDD